MFLHCSLASQQAMLPLAAAMGAGRNILFDLPGHGRSGASPAGIDYQAQAVAIAEALLDEDGPAGPAHVIGHSFGATAALHLALRRPDLVSRLTLIESVFFAAARGTPAHADHQRQFAPFIAAMEAGDRRAAARVFLSIWGGPGGWDGLSAAQKVDMADRIHLIPLAASAMEDDCHGQLAPGRLEGLSCPVDLIEGSEAQPVVRAINDSLAARIARARRTVIAGAGHMAPVTHPRQVAAALV